MRILVNRQFYKLRKYYHFAKAWDTFLFWVPNLILLVEVLLVNAVKNSQSLINVDADSDNFPDIFKERMGLYTMRNMEIVILCEKADVKTPLLSEDSAGNVSMTEQLHEILRLKSQQKLDLQLPEITNLLNVRNQLVMD